MFFRKCDAFLDDAEHIQVIMLPFLTLGSSIPRSYGSILAGSRRACAKLVVCMC